MSLISKDFRLNQHQTRQKGHFRLRWALLAVTCAGIGAVLASTKNVPNSGVAEKVRLDLPQQIKSLDKFNTIEQSKHEIKLASAQESFSISLPAPQLFASPTKTNLTASSLTALNKSQSNSASSTAQAVQIENITQIIRQNIKNISKTLKEDALATNIANKPAWQKYTVKSGDNLGAIFERANLKSQELIAVLKLKKAAKNLRRIFPNDVFHILSDNKGTLQALRYDINLQSYLEVKRDQKGLHSTVHKYPLETRQAHAGGTIKNSLFMAAQKAGVSQNIIMELAGIFGWDIDFALDIRKGDKFTVLYEQHYRDDKKVSNGDILAAEFINNGKVYRAVRYTNPKTKQSEYFTPSGKSMRKAFLRTPVNFSRISSHFSLGRYHPILHRLRAHKGVDYAAKRGTPVYSAGNGKVVFKGIKKGYGRVVIVQHGRKYQTLYAHLNKYNRKTRVGARVSQGQTIAYVGSSGLATGPHLHYEFRVNGVHRNPLTVKLPTSNPVSKHNMADFKSSTATVLAQLDKLADNHQLALAN